MRIATNPIGRASLIRSQSPPRFCIDAPTMDKTYLQGLNITEMALDAPSSLSTTPADRGRRWMLEC